MCDGGGGRVKRKEYQDVEMRRDGGREFLGIEGV